MRSTSCRALIVVALLAANSFASDEIAMPVATHVTVTGSSQPGITSPPLEERGIIGDPTQWYKVQTTAKPDDSSLIGLFNFTQPNGNPGTYYFECINAPFTVVSGYAGCGRDDLYTSCSGNVAAGIDGDKIICTKKGSLCVTYSIFEDLGATTYSPFLGCGDRGAKNFQLVRTWTGSPVVQETDSSMPNPTADSSDSQPRVTDDVQPTETGQSGDAGSAGPTSDNGGPNLRLNICRLICIYLVVTGALMG